MSGTQERVKLAKEIEREAFRAWESGDYLTSAQTWAVAADQYEELGQSNDSFMVRQCEIAALEAYYKLVRGQ